MATHLEPCVPVAGCPGPKPIEREIMEDSSRTDPARSPCTGIRVVDMTQLISGPFCSRILADLGAEVIKVESAGSDVLRQQPPVLDGLGAYFEQVNRGKKSFEVDVKSEHGRDLVRSLAAGADVFIQNSRPGVMERLGLGYAELSAANPRLIYLSINGFGETGPLAHRAAYDAVIQGLTGFMGIQGTEDEPAVVNGVIADKITAMWAANALLAALLERERGDGRGQKVEVNMTSAYAAFVLLDQMHNYTFAADGLPEFRRPPPTRTLHTSDGVVIGYLLQPVQIAKFCAALGRDDLAADPKFGNAASVVQNLAWLYTTVADQVKTMPTAEFLALMDEHSLPFGRVNTVEEFLASPEAEHAEALTVLEDPDYGAIRHLAHPAKFYRTPAVETRRAPRVGEHTAEIIADLERRAST